MAWNVEDKAQIKSRWEGGEHASTIAHDFKTTRNAILGLCDRNGWHSPHKQGTRAGARMHRNPTVPQGPGAQVNRAVARRMRIAGPNYIREIEVTESEPMCSTAEFDAQIPVEQRRQLLKLRPRDCKWPVNDPRDEDFFFCGGEAEPDRPYCAFHCRASYVPHSSRGGDLSLSKWKTTARSGW